MALPRLLTLVIKLRAQVLDSPIKSVRMHKVVDFTSTTFIRYCESSGINFEVSTPHVHTQNGMAKSLIKQVDVIVQLILLKLISPSSSGTYSTSYSSTPIVASIRSCLLSSSTHDRLSTLNFSFMSVWFYNYDPISLDHRKRTRSSTSSRDICGFHSPSIIRYLKPTTDDLFTTPFVNYEFDELTSPML